MLYYSYVAEFIFGFFLVDLLSDKDWFATYLAVYFYEVYS